MVKEFRKKRTRLQTYTSIVFPIVLIGGWFYPPLGFFILLCMVGAIGLSIFRGRSWCDWMCPRGSFYDLFLKKFSRNREIPSYFKATWFRTSILAFLMTALSIQIYLAWGDTRALGMAFLRVLTITTTAGIVLGAIFQERAWCHICPMGTIGSWIAKGKRPLYVNEHCKSCKLCTKACPMQLKPYEHKDGAMAHGDCLKCSSCVAACPINALGFEKELKKAA
jgi:polyferredoxin